MALNNVQKIWWVGVISSGPGHFSGEWRKMEYLSNSFAVWMWLNEKKSSPSLFMEEWGNFQSAWQQKSLFAHRHWKPVTLMTKNTPNLARRQWKRKRVLERAQLFIPLWSWPLCICVLYHNIRYENYTIKAVIFLFGKWLVTEFCLQWMLKVYCIFAYRPHITAATFPPTRTRYSILTSYLMIHSIYLLTTAYVSPTIKPRFNVPIHRIILTLGFYYCFFFKTLRRQGTFEHTFFLFTLLLWQSK